MAKPKVFSVIGTRPDAIKSAPVILELALKPELDPLVVSTGQHREMLDQVCAFFQFQPDFDLGLMKHGQSLSELTTRAVAGIGALLESERPDYVLAQGDTTTTFAASLASFYAGIPFGHIEAGLRTASVKDPFPEEFNRRATGLIATQHFAPTRLAAENLLVEGKDQSSVHITGNTGIDAVMAVSERPGRVWFPQHQGRVILLTTHRRENWGERQQDIVLAARRLVDEFADILLVVPMHRNPEVRATLKKTLDGHPRISLIEPPDYLEFIGLMRRSNLILTDSGGVQEEAPTFGIPVLVLRETTERPEGVTAGTAKLVGVNQEAIYGEAHRLLTNNEAYSAMANAISPYGDGKAAPRIVSLVMRHLNIETPELAPWA